MNRPSMLLRYMHVVATICYQRCLPFIYLIPAYVTLSINAGMTEDYMSFPHIYISWYKRKSSKFKKPPAFTWFRSVLKVFSKIAVLTFLTLMLSNCGFKLVGHQPLPVEIRKIYVQSEKPYDKFTILLKRKLKDSGAFIADKPIDSGCILEISDFGLKYRGDSVQSSSQANVYKITFAMNFKLHGLDGHGVIVSNKISSSRLLTLSPNELFETSNQVEITEQELQKEVIIKLLHVLNSGQVKESLVKK